MGDMSKAELIRALLNDGEFTVRQIAEGLGVKPAYVRVVKQRHLHGGDRPCDARYRTEKYRTDLKYRERILLKRKAWEDKNKTYRNAYHYLYRQRKRQEANA